MHSIAAEGEGEGTRHPESKVVEAQGHWDEVDARNGTEFGASFASLVAKDGQYGTRLATGSGADDDEILQDFDCYRDLA